MKDYFLGGSPVLELCRVAYSIGKRPDILGGVALLTGYCWAAVRRMKRPVTPELVCFHRDEQMQKLKAIVRSARRFKLDKFYHAKYIPSVIRTVKNWPTYFLYYLGIKHGGAAYFFRNGAVIRDQEGTASGTIAVVFIRQHYGSVVGKSTVVEIGANIGIFTIYAATNNKDVKLYAYEPIKSNYDLLVSNIAANGCQARVAAFNLGVASKTERREFYLTSSPEHSLYKSNNCTRIESVDCLCLSDVLDSNSISKVDLLKINAEGAEYEILYSTPTECFDKIDEIRMEYHEQKAEKHNVVCLQSFLRGLGYATTHLHRYSDDDGFLWVKKESVLTVPSK